MVRTQISLNENDYRLVKDEARAQGISVAEFVRRAVIRALAPKSDKPWMRFAGMVETGRADSSQTIDEIVYGTKE